MSEKPIIGLINHGCAKNLVDSELMLGMIANAGYKITLDDAESDFLIINTCSFIHDAEKESVATIVENAEKGKKIIIAGCLPQKHKKELMEAVPEALAFVGPSDISNIVSIIEDLQEGCVKRIYQVSDNPYYIYPEKVERQQITMGASSYIKIAEGCNYKCGYCIIPDLRGPYRSRSQEDIVNEAKELGKKGVSEIVLIAQDTTYYGKEKFGEPILASLLEKLNKVEEIEWIRIMYAYPSMIDDNLIDAIAKLEKVVKYLDIPLQHSHPDVLKSMLRPAYDYSDLIKKMRDKIENLALRTAFIVGYPGETQEQFEHLYNFVEKTRFDKLGVFEYSREKNTYSYDLKPQITAKIKKQRKKEIMLLQQNISKDINQSFVGNEIPSIIENIDSQGQVTGRTYRDAPEIDGLIYINTDKAVLPGDIVNVKVTNADEYDLFGCL